MDNCYVGVELENAIEVQPDSTISKTLHQDSNLKIVLFSFDTGQELSEHTAALPAIMHFLSGSANITIGKDSLKATSNSFYQMQPNAPHSISATEPTKMLLYLIKGASQ